MLNDSHTNIEISFIIPAFNEQDCISNVLESIKRTCTDISYEIIIINNGSTDATEEIAKRFTTKLYNIRRASISHARNFGAFQAKGSLLVFLDADVRITDYWVSALEKNKDMIHRESVVSGNRYDICEAPTFIERSWFFPLSLKPLAYINGGNLLLSKKTFNKIGGFDISLETGEDFQFCKKATTIGVKIKPIHGFRAIHDGYPKTFIDFFKRELWHGKGDYTNIKTFLNSRVAVISLLFGFLNLGFLFTFFAGKYDYSLYFICAIFTLTLIISAYIFLKYSITYCILNLPLVFLYLFSRHLSLYTTVWTNIKKTLLYKDKKNS